MTGLLWLIVAVLVLAALILVALQREWARLERVRRRRAAAAKIARIVRALGAANAAQAQLGLATTNARDEFEGLRWRMDDAAPVSAIGTVIWAPVGPSVHFDGYPSPPAYAGERSLNGDGWAMRPSQLEHTGSPLVRPLRWLLATPRTRRLRREHQRRVSAGLL